MSGQIDSMALGKGSIDKEDISSDIIQVDVGHDKSMASYRAAYRSISRLMNALWVVVFLLLCGTFYVISSYKPEGAYYFLSEAGGKRRVPALRDPNISKAFVTSWAEQVASEVMTFGFADYDVKLGATRKYFTEDGWSSFQVKMMGSGFFKTVLQVQQILTAVPRSSATIVWQGVMSGNYVYIVQVPLMVMVRAGDVRKSDAVNVRLVVNKVPTSQSPSGLAISRWISY